MVTRETVKHALIGRDVAVVFAVIVVLYLIRLIRFQPLQIPAYLLIVAYDFVEIALPVLTPYYSVGFPIFLYLLAIIGAGAARWFQSGSEENSVWVRAIGGVALVVGLLSLLFGAFVGGPIASPTDNPTPFAITGATGLILLMLAWWLLGRPSPRAPLDH